MNYTTHDIVQGTDGWAVHRSAHLNGSDAAAMLGISKFKSRTDLVREYATGVQAEIDPATQKRFDDGHAYEAAARPLVEVDIADELFPSTVSRTVDGLPLSSSLDGFTMDGRRTWEHKTLNSALESALRQQEIPAEYHPQLEQGLLITGAESALFSASRGTPETLLTVEYRSNPELREKIIAGWKQLQADVAAYIPETVTAAPVAAAVEGFGALMLRVEGRVLSTNLDAFKAGAEAFIARLPKPADLQTDQDFVDAIAAVKACEDAEDRIKAEKAAALAQMADVDAVMRAADNISEIIRAARLSLDRVVKAEKDNRKNDLIRGGVDAIRDHYHAINPTVAGFEISIPGSLSVDMGAAIKGLKSLDSMRDKISAAVANAKISASQEADRRRACIALLPDDRSLFPDVRELVATKQPDDLKNLIAARIADHKAREQARLDAERARIRAEEEARAQREADAKADQERQRIRAEEQAKARQEAEDRRRLDAHASAERSAATVETMASSEEPPKYDAKPSNDSGARIRLGELNALIAPLSISADGLAQLGFEHVATDKAAKLYRASDLPRILGAMSRHLMSADKLGRAA